MVASIVGEYWWRILMEAFMMAITTAATWRGKFVRGSGSHNDGNSHLTY